jgi:integrase
MARTTKGRMFQRGKRWYVQYYVNGRQIAQSLGTTDKREAARLFDERMAGLRLNDRAKQTQAAAAALATAETELAQWQEDHRARLALADAWPKYIAARNRPQSGAHTLADYARQWKRFAEWMKANHPKRRNLEDVTAADAGDFLLHLEGLGLGANRYNKAIQALRLVFRVLASQCSGMANPFADCQPKPLEPERHRELSEAELTRICSTAAGELRTLLALGLYCGFRVADAAQLRWDEIDLAAGVITRAPSKTKRRTKKRVAPSIHPTLAAILSETPPESRTGPLLPEFCESYRHDNGSKIAKIIREHFKACGVATAEHIEGRKMGVARATFHSLRHTLVSTLHRRGIPLGDVRELVGHTSEAIQRVYLHTNNDDMRKAVNAMPSMADAFALPAGDTAVPAGAVTLDDLRRDVNRAATAADAETLRRMLAAASLSTVCQ